ncbi:MAG: cytochrome c4 [Azonexus sp.]|nr:cytochrome c4 [Betaproteobacteria bacterium]MBK8916864.1 cytochrome c4 [Betaproteobacteria bacterium]MBP6036985.1 cytochrome c4 [Azonexus sp.]MBP6907574.1 cytochrome c4 [Azonexus sp.]
MIRKTVLAILLATPFIAFAKEEAKPKADLARGKALAETICVACHGADGNSPASTNPHLAGQVEQYIYKQLSNFKAGDNKPALRNNAIMGGMAAPLTDDDMRALAAWFSQQKLKPAAAKDDKQIALGQKLWRQGDFAKGVPACAGCHGPAGAGLPAQYPRLSGQYADYTEAQLKAFRQGERANDPEKMMRTIAAKLSDAEIKAVSDYAAGLR